MDGAVTEDEIREPISESISTKVDTFEIRALRPDFRNTQNVTVTIPAAEAK